MTTVAFHYPISKTRYYEGELRCYCEVQDDQVKIISVFKQLPGGKNIEITDCLPAHGFCEQDIILMALNNAPEWAVHNEEEEKETQYWNDFTGSYERN